MPIKILKNIVVIYFISFWVSCTYCNALMKAVCAGIYSRNSRYNFEMMCRNIQGFRTIIMDVVRQFIMKFYGCPVGSLKTHFTTITQSV